MADDETAGVRGNATAMSIATPTTPTTTATTMMMDKEGEQPLLDDNNNTADEDSGAESESNENEPRRKQAFEQMTRIEREFSHLKNRLYEEKLTGVKNEMEQIQAGKHERFCELLKALEKKLDDRLQVSESNRNRQMQSLQTQYEAERESAKSDYNMEKRNLREKMLTSLQDKQRKLEDEKANIDITTELTTDMLSMPTRKLRRRAPDTAMETKSSKKRMILGPAIVSSLTEKDIIDDLYKIHESYSASSKRKLGRIDPSVYDKESVEAYYQSGCLVCEKHRYQPGEAVYVEQKDIRYPGNIVAVSPSEIFVRRTDGTKSKLYISQLRLGRASIRPKA